MVLARLAALRSHSSTRCPRRTLRRYPFCLQGDDAPGPSNCTFDTYTQCMTTRSGRRRTCIANPYFVGGSDDPYAYPTAAGRSRRNTFRRHRAITRARATDAKATRADCRTSERELTPKVGIGPLRAGGGSDGQGDSPGVGGCEPRRSRPWRRGGRTSLLHPGLRFRRRRRRLQFFIPLAVSGDGFRTRRHLRRKSLFQRQGGGAARSHPRVPKKVLMRSLALTVLAAGARCGATSSAAPTEC